MQVETVTTFQGELEDDPWTVDLNLNDITQELKRHIGKKVKVVITIEE